MTADLRKVATTMPISRALLEDAGLLKPDGSPRRTPVPPWPATRIRTALDDLTFRLIVGHDRLTSWATSEFWPRWRLLRRRPLR